MLTTTHALVGLATLSERDAPKRNIWVLIGSLIPDAAIFVWAPWQRWGLGRDWQAIWDQHYFEAPMQTLIAGFNSVPLYLVLMLMGLWQRSQTGGRLLLVFSLAALLHIALDAPVHASDAYRHLWPLSDFRFYSPLSYWEADHHARWVALFEAGLVMLCTLILWRRFSALWARALLALLLIFTAVNVLAQNLAAIQVPS